MRRRAEELSVIGAMAGLASDASAPGTIEVAATTSFMSSDRDGSVEVAGACVGIRTITAAVHIARANAGTSAIEAILRPARAVLGNRLLKNGTTIPALALSRSAA